MTGVADEELVFLLDVDNTLLDNDRLKRDLAGRIERMIGRERAARFWDLYEHVRRERDHVDFPRTVEMLAQTCHDSTLVQQLNGLLADFPYPDYLYPGVLETIGYLRSIGTVVILSDGDSEFQPMKIRKSGLEPSVGGNVLVYVHKEDELRDIFARYPSQCYVLVDDKPRIIAALERLCPTRFTTVLVLQGKYAERHDVAPKPDYTIGSIGDLRTMTREQFLAPSRPTVP